MTSLPRLVLLGTGTDVGKTYLGVALTRALRSLGHDVLALKPVESGLPETPPGQLPKSGDAADLGRVASQGAAPRYGLPDPISPHLAARRVGSTIELSELVAWVEEQEESFLESTPRRPIVLIETAGGCFSPLSERHTNFDLALALDPATWILAAPDSLGVLHDVQATLRAMAARLPEFLVVSEARPQDDSTGTNAEEIERVVLSQLASLGRRPTVSTLGRDSEPDALAKTLSARLQ